MRFRHDGNVGDIIYSLPAAFNLAKAEPITFYLGLGQRANYGTTIKHPLGMTTLNQDYAERLIPLLESQPQIERATIHSGEHVDYDLNLFRRTGFDYGRGHIAHYYRYAFLCQPRTWEPWLSVEPDPAFAGTILVNRTKRYQNKNLSYSFLRRYPNVKFMGLPEEYGDWHSTFRINCPAYYPKTFLDAARAIAGCALFIGNQSSSFAIAEGLKFKRILEVCPWVPNVVVTGENGYEAFGQKLFEKMVETLAH